MRWLALCFVLSAAGVFAQAPVGTILPAQFNNSLDSAKSRSGQVVTARVMQDVPISPTKKIHAGAKLIGHLENVRRGDQGQRAEMSLRFDRLKLGREVVAITTSLRAMASMTEVEGVLVPPTGPDRGTPWAWTTRNLIGGEVAYGADGPVARGDEIVGQALTSGVLIPLRANTASGCRGTVEGNSQPQPTWVFSSDACGLYGFENMQIAHAGRTTPLGEITLTSTQGKVQIKAGSGILLRVIGPPVPSEVHLP